MDYLQKLRELSVALQNDKLLFEHEPSSPDDHPPTRITLERVVRKYILTIIHGGQYVDYPDTFFEPGVTGWIDQEQTTVIKDSLVKAILYIEKEFSHVFNNTDARWLSDLKKSSLAYGKP